MTEDNTLSPQTHVRRVAIAALDGEKAARERVCPGRNLAMSRRVSAVAGEIFSGTRYYEAASNLVALEMPADDAVGEFGFAEGHRTGKATCDTLICDDANLAFSRCVRVGLSRNGMSCFARNRACGRT